MIKSDRIIYQAIKAIAFGTLQTFILLNSFSIMTQSTTDRIQAIDSPFKRIRVQAGLTQEKLAKEIGVAVSSIRRWEKGQAEPTMTEEARRTWFGMGKSRC